MRVTHFQRKPRPLGNFSIESYFKTIRALAPDDIKIKLCEAPVYSNGLLDRIKIIFHAIQHQSEINHITGDIHFVTPFLRKGKRILTIHDCGQLHRSKGIKKAILKFFWFTWPCRSADIITVNSEFTKRDLLNFVSVPPDKIKVIYIFVPDVFKRFDKPFNAIKPRILQIGTAPNKNLVNTIPALEDIDCTFVIVGNPTDAIRELLYKHKVEHEIIDRALTENELYEEYKKCDIISFISDFEGFGMPIVEGQIVGRPVITSYNASMPEVAADGACKVDGYNPIEIKNGFKRIIDHADQRNALIEIGYKNSKRFSAEMVTEKYFTLYRIIK